jgi:hypothetical protein
MSKDIKVEFNKIFKGQVNKEFCFIKKNEFIEHFKKIISSLNNNNICFSFKTDTNEEDYQFSGAMSDISLNDTQIKMLGDFKQTCRDNESTELILPLNEINEEIELVFHPAPWLEPIFKQEMPKTTDIIFTEIIEKDGSDRYDYKQYQIVFYFSLEGMLSDLLTNKNIARRVEFTAEEDVLNFFTNIKQHLIGKDIDYWVDGMVGDVTTPILNIEFTKDGDENIIELSTEYGKEIIHVQYVQGIQLSDNFLYFDQRQWNGSEYKIIL